MAYCVFPVRSDCQCGKCKDFTGGWNCKCGKCGEGCAGSIWELEKKYPPFKDLLNSWKNKHDSASWICSRCWKKEIVEAKEKEEEDIKKKRKNQHISSHCHTCNTKSTFFHYIYDKNTGKVWDSWSNAPDPDNQLVFCNQTCFNKYMEKQNAYICAECGKKGSGDYIYSKTDPERKKFCSKEHWRDYTKKKVNEVYQEEIDELNKKLDDLNQRQLDNVNELMKKGYDLDFDFENASWLSDKNKAICRKYQQNREEVKRLKKQQNQSDDESLSSGSTDSSSRDESEKTCDKCRQQGTKYNIPSKNDGKEFCSKKCCADYYQRKQDNSSSDNDHAKTCDQCSKEISRGEKSYYADAENKTGTLCSTCLDKELKNDNNSDKSNIPLPTINFSDSNPSQNKLFRETLEKIINNGGEEIIFPCDVSPKQRIFLEVIHNAKLGKYSGENSLNYDKLNLSESEKGELNSLLIKLGNSFNSSRSFGDSLENKSMMPQILLIGITVLFFAIIIGVVLKKRSKKS